MTRVNESASLTNRQQLLHTSQQPSNMAAVDVEDESILASIFKDSFPDSWRDNPDFAAYLSELSSFGVEKLSREPERLAEERAQILQQTRELAFSNYQTFIRTADCTEHIYRDFGRVESSVSRLLDKLPSFGEKCRSVPLRDGEPRGPWTVRGPRESRSRSGSRSGSSCFNTSVCLLILKLMKSVKSVIYLKSMMGCYSHSCMLRHQ